METELGLSHFVAGLLPSVFLVGYFMSSPLFGVTADRGGRFGRAGTRTVLSAVGVAVWSAATVGSGLARGKASMLLSRAVVGVGEASYATIAPTLVDDVAPAKRASVWMAIYCAATPVGSALGYLVGGAVMHARGWRAAFFVAGAPGLLLAVLCLLIGEPARRHPSRLGLFAGARELAGIGLYRTSVLGYAAYAFAIGGLAYWAPSYLTVRYGVEAGKAGLEFGLITVVGGAVGTFLGGYIADRAAEKRVNRLAVLAGKAPAGRVADDAVARTNAMVAAAACALGAPLSLLAILSPTANGFLMLALPCEMALFVLSGPINVALLRAAPPALRASAMAICNFAIHAFGDLWSPPLIGLVADHAPMQAALYTVPLAFAGAAFALWQAAWASARLT